MPLKRERPSLQCLVSQLQDSPALAALPVEIVQQIGSHLDTKQRWDARRSTMVLVLQKAHSCGSSADRILKDA